MMQLENIGREYTMGSEKVHALVDLNLTIEAGDYVSIMGPSGSGKSTLLNILGLLDRPDRGRYFFAGLETARLPDVDLARLRREKMGFVFQFFHLIPRLTAYQNVELPLVLSKIDPDERRQRVDELLSSFGLAERSHHRPDELSGGQRQRVAIARAIAMRPAVVLADEPTGNLDRHSGQDVVHILENLHVEGIALVVVTHDPALGERAAKKISMVDGAIVNII